MARKLKEYAVGRGARRRNVDIYLDVDKGTFSTRVDDMSLEDNTLQGLKDKVREVAEANTPMTFVPAIRFHEADRTGSAPVSLEVMEVCVDPAVGLMARRAAEAVKDPVDGRIVGVEPVEGSSIDDVQYGLYIMALDDPVLLHAQDLSDFMGTVQELRKRLEAVSTRAKSRIEGLYQRKKRTDRFRSVSKQIATPEHGEEMVEIVDMVRNAISVELHHWLTAHGDDGK